MLVAPREVNHEFFVKKEKRVVPEHRQIAVIYCDGGEGKRLIVNVRKGFDESEAEESGLNFLSSAPPALQQSQVFCVYSESSRTKSLDVFVGKEIGVGIGFLVAACIAFFGGRWAIAHRRMGVDRAHR